MYGWWALQISLSSMLHINRRTRFDSSEDISIFEVFDSHNQRVRSTVALLVSKSGRHTRPAHRGARPCIGLGATEHGASSFFARSRFVNIKTFVVVFCGQRIQFLTSFTGLKEASISMEETVKSDKWNERHEKVTSDCPWASPLSPAEMVIDSVTSPAPSQLPVSSL